MRYREEDLDGWDFDPPHADEDVTYAAEIVLDLGRVSPHVAGPDSVQVMRSVADIEAEKMVVHKAYLVSCTNSRREDIEAAAKVIKGKKVADGVELYVAAASKEIQDATEDSGA